MIIKHETKVIVLVMPFEDIIEEKLSNRKLSLKIHYAEIALPFPGCNSNTSFQFVTKQASIV